MYEAKHLINGQLVEGKGKKFSVLNPATEEVISEFHGIDAEQTEEVLHAAQKAFETWSKLSIKEREVYILKFADLIVANRDKIIQMIIDETGKSYEGADEDYQMLPDCLRYFNEEMKTMSGHMLSDLDNKHANMIIRKPLGVVVGYLAWNFPLLNLGYKLGPILASGCTCILKPSSQTPLATMYVGELAVQAGIPAGVINIIVGDNNIVGTKLNESTIPQMITLIGSSATGAHVMRQAATSIKHYSMELGGNDPAVVMGDADVENAAAKITGLKVGNGGQICVAPNRVFVHESVMDAFLGCVASILKDVTYCSGKYEGPATQMIPLSSAKAVANMEALVADAVSKGATVLIGGKRHEGKGFFFEPTVLTGVTPEMRVYQEEIFGPIMPVLSFSDQDDIVKMANDTCYGLAAYIYTNNLTTAMNLSRQIDAGDVLVNEPCFCYNLPHGGCKQSGIGKDCSVFSLEEYFYLQRITIKL